MSMSEQEWRGFLKQYSIELLKSADLHLSVEIPDEAREAQWLGFSPATGDEIASAEGRLGRQLPPSLKTFYRVTNGWIVSGYFVYDVLPVNQLGWLSGREPDLFQLVSETENETAAFEDDPKDALLRDYRFEQGTRVKRSLVLNANGDASTWLLDPDTVDSNGEWAGGRWSAWNPAMEWISDSFEQLVLDEYHTFIRLRDQT